MKKLSLELRQSVPGSSRLAWATQQVANQLGLDRERKRKQLRHGWFVGSKGKAGLHSCLGMESCGEIRCSMIDKSSSNEYIDIGLTKKYW